MKRKNVADELVEAMREAAAIAQGESEAGAPPFTRHKCEGARPWRSFIAVRVGDREL